MKNKVVILIVILGFVACYPDIERAVKYLNRSVDQSIKQSQYEMYWHPGQRPTKEKDGSWTWKEINPNISDSEMVRLVQLRNREVETFEQSPEFNTVEKRNVFGFTSTTETIKGITYTIVFLGFMVTWPLWAIAGLSFLVNVIGGGSPLLGGIVAGVGTKQIASGLGFHNTTSTVAGTLVGIHTYNTLKD